MNLAVQNHLVLWTETREGEDRAHFRATWEPFRWVVAI